jgi:hypothetical protein
MNIAEKFERIIKARDRIIAKLMEFGVTDKAVKIEEAAEMLDGIEKHSNVEAEVTVGKDYTIPKGYHDGSSVVMVDRAEQEKLIPDNIREGVTLFGVEGTLNGLSDIKAQSMEVDPSFEEQTVVPDADHNFLDAVVVKAIPYVESDNQAGGKTVTIG